jgi:cell division protease FtsH
MEGNPELFLSFGRSFFQLFHNKGASQMDRKKKQMKFSLGYMLIALLVVWLFNDLVLRPMLIGETETAYSKFLDDLAGGRVEEVSLTDDRIYFTLRGELATRPSLRNTIRVEDPELVNRLVEAKIPFKARDQTQGILESLLGWILPFLPLLLIWYFLFQRISQGGAGVMSVGKSKAREIHGEMTGVTFKDLGGLDEAEVELKEIIDYLTEPKRFNRMGAKLPKGVLLVGPPGTGKTMLAKATAGEAKVPFFFLTGSSFVEMFVGVGAARVRDLFLQAKKKAPCIIFIDEIDAIGQARSTMAAMGGNSERENTLNQLLGEMDGFDSNQGVVIMAATNRPEILDAALLRPGRFDRQVQVTLPTEGGRREILKIHTRDMPLGEDADLERIARITPGFSGADLANIANEASLLAVRKNRDSLTMEDFDLAIERVIAGLQRKVPLRKELREKVAFHEGGHALVAQLLPCTDPVHKVSIIPTAKGALGYTMQMPEEDQYLIGEKELLSRMAVMLGGRASELLIFQEASTGASNDLERVTDLARRMVTEFGMSEKLGPLRLALPAGSGYLGIQQGNRQDLSPETAALIDNEIRRLVQEAHQKAFSLLQKHEEALREIARTLQEEEVIQGERIRHIVETFPPGTVTVPEAPDSSVGA